MRPVDAKFLDPEGLETVRATLTWALGAHAMATHAARFMTHSIMRIVRCSTIYYIISIHSSPNTLDETWGL